MNSDNIRGCPLCGAPPLQSCTPSCDDDNVPDDEVALHPRAVIFGPPYMSVAQARMLYAQEKLAQALAGERDFSFFYGDGKGDFVNTIEIDLPAPTFYKAVHRVSNEPLALRNDKCECGAKMPRGNVTHSSWCPWRQP